MACKCELIKGNACPNSMENYEECPFYDSNGDWCYYVEPMKRVG